MGVGFQEGLIILAVVVVIMGAGRIPQIGDALGRGIVNFRRALKGEDSVDVTPPKDPLPPGGEQDKTDRSA